eukprot:TRINITY_DN11199_c0_g1_i3.p2 TRINITY_DN11199_c0_g1~~TRINITY_DN11199_c0_g1_i3.p2  ORF type:complete len:152 (-),score=55.08 TRINITY_DN11199_c0_g1_i3:178-633(-)
MLRSLVGSEMCIRDRYTSFDNQSTSYQAYKDRLLDLQKQLPHDDEVAAFAAEALMVIQCDGAGYHFYDGEGMPTAETRLGSELLQGVLARTPSHPMAEHLWIHITEPSASGMGPESAGRAAAAADGLLAQFNGTDSQHLTHMPGHLSLIHI